MRRTHTILLIAALCSAATPLLLRPWGDSSPSDKEMARCTQAFLQSLDDAQRGKASFAFDDAERKKWHFVPARYPGLELGAMNDKQKVLAHKLLRSALSASGYHKTTTIIALEEVLRRAAEARGNKAEHRDPARYAFAVFGTPGTKKPWGFRVQGHHVSLNFTSVGGKVVASTPAFLGANPAEVRQGPYAGLRALPDEADLGFALLDSCDAAQLQKVMLSDKAPADILWGPNRRKKVLGEIRGLSQADMLPEQRRLLWQLVECYLRNMKEPLAKAQLAKVQAAGIEKIHFCWMGSKKPGKGHYYRVHGPSFCIEYDNTQNGANHVHTVWHDMSDDFAVDLLGKHYHEQHGK